MCCLEALSFVCHKILSSPETLRGPWAYSSSWTSGHCEHGGQAAEWIGNHFLRAQKIKMCMTVWPMPECGCCVKKLFEVDSDWFRLIQGVWFLPTEHSFLSWPADPFLWQRMKPTISAFNQLWKWSCHKDVTFFRPVKTDADAIVENSQWKYEQEVTWP